MSQEGCCEPLRLTRARLQDLEQLKAWFTEQRSLSDWAGPGLHYPISMGVFLQPIRWQELSSYSMLSNDGELLAFGQFYIRLGRHHLGRLAVSPNHRNRGLGKQLIRQLIEQARIEQPASGLSLFVMEDNIPALACYLSLGFRHAVYSEALSGGLENCSYMIRD